MIVLITKWFPVIGKDGYPTGSKELLVDHAIDLETNEIVPVPSHPPESFPGAYFHGEIGEYVMEDK